MRDQQRYIDLAIRWAAFGGPRDEDIFVNFGVRPRLYFQRVHRFVGDPDRQGIAEHIRCSVLRNCEARLAELGWTVRANAITDHGTAAMAHTPAHHPLDTLKGAPNAPTTDAERDP